MEKNEVSLGGLRGTGRGEGMEEIFPRVMKVIVT